MAPMKFLYKPFGFVAGMIATTVAVRAWRGSWRLLTGEDTPPAVLDRDSSWTKMVVSSAMRGVVFAVVRSVIRRAGATAFAKVTGTWPGKSTEAETREG